MRQSFVPAQAERDQTRFSTALRDGAATRKVARRSKIGAPCRPRFAPAKTHRTSRDRAHVRAVDLPVVIDVPTGLERSSRLDLPSQSEGVQNVHPSVMIDVFAYEGRSRRSRPGDRVNEPRDYDERGGHCRPRQERLPGEQRSSPSFQMFPGFGQYRRIHRRRD